MLMTPPMKTAWKTRPTTTAKISTGMAMMTAGTWMTMVEMTGATMVVGMKAVRPKAPVSLAGA